MSRKNMRIIALGGCGGMGRFAVRTAIGFEFVKEVIVADVNKETADTFATECGSKVRPMQMDVGDTGEVVKLLSGADAVLSSVGPYYRFGVPILRAAIEAGCDYIDINDDWEPTLDMLALHEDAREAGITAIVGMGASPGFSNMLAVKAMDQLDTVEDLITGWGAGNGRRRRNSDSTSGSGEEVTAPSSGNGYSAALDHWLHQISGKIRVFKDGEYADVSPLQEVIIDYPGVGEGSVYTVGHPEPVTIPLSRKEIRNSCNVMVTSPRLIGILKRIAAEIDSGRKTIREAVPLVFNPPESWLSDQGSKPETQDVQLPRLFAYAKGLRDGNPKSVAATLTAGPPGGMGGSTGIPMAIGLKMLAQGRIGKKGVFTPEACIDPDVFFDECVPYSEPRRKNGKEMVMITTSP